MLSNQFSSISLRDITVERAGRVRREIKADAVAALADSIARLGLLHPIVITRENVLVAGETRLAAFTRLGYDRIPFQFADTLEPKELLALELEENLKRTDLSWQEKCDALARFHRLQQDLHADWSVKQTGDALGISERAILAQIRVADALSDPKIAETKLYSTARGLVARQAERAKADEAELIVPRQTESPIEVADFLQWADDYDGPSFNFIHCDFPYGINADKFAQGAAKSFGGYADTPEVYWALVCKLIEQREKLLGESGHILFWFSMKHYAATLQTLSANFWVDPYPLIWFKINTGTLPDPQRGPRRVYETAFLCSHGDRKIISATSNVCAAQVVRTGEHMSEKSPEMLRYFMRMVVDENTRMLDPTCGSGSALRAAHSLGAKSVLGLEKDEAFAAAATRAWDEATSGSLL